MKLSFTDLLHNASKIVMPPTPIGGLQITNSSIRYMEFHPDPKSGTTKVKTASLRLPPGIIEGGRIKDVPNFISALKSVHAQITPREKEMVNVVLTIPAGDVYVEAFKLPVLGANNISEAADLNMQMISPNPIDKTYYSWMMVGDASQSAGEIEILGAFVLKEVVDAMTSALEEAGFGVAAVEFSSLSLNRVLVESGYVRKETPYLLLKITQEGMIFMIIRNGNLYFNYFHPWDNLSEAGEVTLEQVNAIIRTESQRVMNFYTSHYGGQIKSMLVITSVFSDEIMAFLNEQYPALEKVLIRSDKENLHGVRGAALRGNINRLEDSQISLMSPTALNAFWREKIRRFITLWRNSLITTAGFIFAVFGISYMFIAAQANAIADANAVNLREPETGELILLQNQAKSFNNQVAALKKVGTMTQHLSPVMERLNAAATGLVTIQRLSIRADKNAVIDGVAGNQDAIIAFKNRLSAVPNFTEVTLPLSSIVAQANGTWSFTLSFKIAF